MKAETRKKVTVPSIRDAKGVRRIGMLTAYDYPSARMVDLAGADINLMVPVWICIMVPMILMFFVGQHPDLWWVRVLSFVPFFTPFLMVNRLASVVPPGPLEIALSVAVMVLACWGATYLAARVFRVGILLYGKPATPRELWRWLRTG